MSRLLALVLLLLPGSVLAQDPVFDPQAGFATVTALDATHLVVRNNDVDFVCSLAPDGQGMTLHNCLPIRFAAFPELTLASLGNVPDADIADYVFDMIAAQGCVLDTSDRAATEATLVAAIAGRLGGNIPLPEVLARAILERLDSVFEDTGLQERLIVDRDAKTLTLRDC